MALAFNTHDCLLPGGLRNAVAYFVLRVTVTPPFSPPRVANVENLRSQRLALMQTVMRSNDAHLRPLTNTVAAHEHVSTRFLSAARCRLSTEPTSIPILTMMPRRMPVERHNADYQLLQIACCRPYRAQPA